MALLFKRHARAIYNYCFRSVGDWAAAEDLLSAVFLEAWRRRDKELVGENVLPWLYGIASNLIRNQRRSQRRFAAALLRLPAPRPEADFVGTSEDRLDDERRMREALDLLSQVPEREREVFVLCAWMELSYEDVAVALDIPIGTVRSRLSRARARLRELNPASGHIESEKHPSDENANLEPRDLNPTTPRSTTRSSGGARESPPG
jgi:RNA polymerase sigma-70 factor (ECF subfamily)